MEITPVALYWITRLNGVNETFVGLAALAFIGIVLFGGLYFVQIMDDVPKTQREFVLVRRVFYSAIGAFLVFWFGAVFIPTSKQVKEMFGYVQIEKVCNCNE